MALFITGDTHGSQRAHMNDVDGYMHRFNTDSFPEQKELTKDDYVIICGDFGGIWDSNRERVEESKQEKYGLKWLENKPFTTLFVPGNHENYDRLTGIEDEALLNSWLFAKMPDEEKEKFRQGYPRKEWHGGYVREIRPSILMLEAGVFDIDGTKVFAYGGAPSHDIQGGILNPADFETEKEFKVVYVKWYMEEQCRMRQPFRVKGVSWWEQEQPSAKIEQQAVEALEKANWKVDFIVTHDAARIDRALMGYGDEITRLNIFLEEVKFKTDYKHWFFGHLHDNQNLPGYKEHLIYEQIVQVH